MSLGGQPPAGLGSVRRQRHGAYRLRGLRRAVPVWEVGEEGHARFRTPRRPYPGALPTSAWILIAAVLLLGSTLLQRFVPAWRPARALPAVNLAILPATAADDVSPDRTLLEGMAQAVLDRLAHRKQEQQLPLRLVPVADVLEERLVATSEVRRRFGATHVLAVGWRRDGDPVRLGITLYDATSEDTIGAQPIEARDANLLGAAQRAADLTLDWLGFPPLSRANTETSHRQTANARAYRLYLQGLGELARYDPSLQASNAAAVLQAATAEDSGFAPAFAALSEAHWWMYQHTRDRTHIENALTSVLRAMERTTNRLAAAEYAAGLLRLGRGQASPAAESFQRALNLDPAYTRARTMLARAHEEAGPQVTLHPLPLFRRTAQRRGGVEGQPPGQGQRRPRNAQVLYPALRQQGRETRTGPAHCDPLRPEPRAPQYPVARSASRSGPSSSSGNTPNTKTTPLADPITRSSATPIRPAVPPETSELGATYACFNTRR